MKRLKSVLPYLIAFVLVVTLMHGAFGAIFARGADVTDPDAVNYHETTEFFSDTTPAKMVTKVKLGDPIELPAPSGGVIVSVTAPNGSVTDSDDDPEIVGADEDDWIVATQEGNYVITYSKGDNLSYSYNVLCVEEKEYFINVKEYDRNSFIPAYRASHDSDKADAEANKVLSVPEFELAYTNSKGEVKSVDPAKYVVDIDWTKSLVLSDDDIDFLDEDDTDLNTLPNKLIPTAFNKLSNGVFTLVFKAKLLTGDDDADKSETAGKWYKKEYNVNVQKNFVDVVAPTLSVSSMTGTANLMTQVTLPTFSATDNYEGNVIIEIEVTAPITDANPEGKVYGYQADKDGYAKLDTKSEKPLVFDNKNVRSFFVTEPGAYFIKATAVDGVGLSSTTHTYRVDVADKLAPVIKKIDDTKIPTKWGHTVNATANRAINIPFLTAIDNVTDYEDLRLVVTISNPKRTMARWDADIKDYLEGDGVKVVETYKSYFKDGVDSNFKEGMTFWFGMFDYDGKAIISGNENKYGQWTITYTLWDDANNGGSGNARKSYTIDVVQSFTDREAPVISQSDLELPEYVLIDEIENTEFTVPEIASTDNNATRSLRIEYILTSNAAPVEDADGEIESVVFEDDDTVYELVAREADTGSYVGKYFYNFKGGENLPIRSAEIDDEDVYFLLISNSDGDFAMPLAGKNADPNITFTYTVWDDVNNESKYDPDKSIASDAPGKSWVSEPIQFIYPESLGQDHIEIDVTEMENKAHTLTDPTDWITAGTNVRKELGSFTIKGIEWRQYTGFEFAIYDEYGESMEAESYVYRVPSSVSGEFEIVVRDISFLPTIGGIYTVNIRAFDISGTSVVTGFSFGGIDPAPTTPGGPVGSSANSAATGVHDEYSLDKEFWVESLNYENYTVVRKIEGRSYGLVSNKFTAHIAGQYTITEYLWEYKDDQGQLNNNFNKDDTNILEPQGGVINITASDTTTPNIIFQEFISSDWYNTISITDDDTVEGVFNPDKPEEYRILPLITAYSKYENATLEMEMIFKSSGEEVFLQPLYIDNNDKLTFEKNDGQGGDDYKVDGRWAFFAAKDGTYTLTVTATTPSGQTSTYSTDLKMGKRTLPIFSVEYPSSTAKKGDTFSYGVVTIDSSLAANKDWKTLTVTLKRPDKTTELELNLDKAGYEAFNPDDWNTSYEFNDTGFYVVVYTMVDEAGNISTFTHTITVTAEGSDSPANLTALTVVLIVIGVLLIAGVVVYILRFRTTKNKSATTSKANPSDK